MKKVRVSLAQINPTVGDLHGNARKVVSYIRKARRLQSDIIAFPELAVTGYPPEDLLLKPHFVDDNIETLHSRILPSTENITAIVGFVDSGDGLFNAAAVLSDRRFVDSYHKIHLPNYGVFDELRYFRAGKRYPVYHLRGIGLGINVCEDIWDKRSPAIIQVLNGAELILNINASPYHMGKAVFRQERVSELASLCDCVFAYVNMVGGQDELVFDGGSFVVGRTGEIVSKGRQFVEEMITVDIELSGKKKKKPACNEKNLTNRLFEDESVAKIKIPSAHFHAHKTPVRKKIARPLSAHEEVYNALLLGTRDYVHKNGFREAVIGMSGGIDSALVVTIAVDALGKGNVHGLFMPSRFTSQESHEDVHEHGRNLGITVTTISIDTIFDVYLKELASFFRGREPDITEENLQARIRGNLLMAFSNKFEWIVLTTGNKSEMSVGYATLYGDMAGGFAVIKDVPKTLVYSIGKWRNEKEHRVLIPERLFWKEPSAELKADQRDADTLPPYPELDPVVKAYVEDDKNFDEIVNLGCEEECVKRIISMVDHSEYKRRQAPPGIKITPRAFGKDRRFPITNKYRSY